MKKRKKSATTRRPLNKKTLRRVRTAGTAASSRYTVGGKRNKKRKPVSVAKTAKRKAVRKPKPTASVTEIAEATQKLQEYHEPRVDDPGEHVRVIPNKSDEQPGVRDVQPVLQGDDSPELPGETEPT